LVANAWIPLPDRRTDLSTKSIHHHGELLLTTATAFGPGYEHWMLALPQTLDPDRHLHRMELIAHGRHALHEVTFVDAYTAHVPLYPAELTITYCLWSARQPKTWRDSLKRIPLVQRHSATLRRAVTRLGLASRLEVKNVEYFDFYPTDQGFVAMRERDEFPLGPNANYLRSLMHVIQATGNADLAPLIRAALQRGEVDDAPLAEELLARLEAGTPIDGVLSDGHVGVEHANFTREAIERALQAQRTATAAN
ncbi:MAG TPA: hypothetical protein VHE14_08660, partial [Solirubrobacteraceae bacterium]|nr:hypothetical protein [Solirubrobacteraceae bacterium]